MKGDNKLKYAGRKFGSVYDVLLHSLKGLFISFVCTPRILDMETFLLLVVTAWRRIWHDSSVENLSHYNIAACDK